jgi:hypothetical protein
MTMPLGSQGGTAFKHSIPTDSLRDILPLSIGNQWTYSYSYVYNDDPQIAVHYDEADTGTVTFQITGVITAADSTRWILEERSTHWTRFNLGPWNGPSVRIDTSEIVELHAGMHQIYRTGDLGPLRLSALPLLPNFVDTARINRFVVMNSDSQITIKTTEVPRTYDYRFTFVPDVGLSSMKMFRGCTCLPTFGTTVTLRSSIITSVSDLGSQKWPIRCQLDQNYPNPFNPTTSIPFSLPVECHVTLDVFDIVGRHVEQLISETLSSGKHIVAWQPRHLASGIYFYRLQAVGYVQTRMLLLLE